MNFFLILFFASLFGIIGMIGRKLFLLKRAPVVILEEKTLIETPSFGEIRYVFIKKTREYTFIALVEIIRFSVRSSKFLKRKYQELEKMIQKMARKNKAGEEIKQKEVSGFLKKISEYKQKVRKIRDQVIEEEKGN